MAIKFLSDTTHKKGDIHLDGTSSERLDLDSGVKITGQYKANGNTEYTYINMYNGGNASINIGTKHNLGYISFESGNGAYTERMRITNTGNIGIGTTNPAAYADSADDLVVQSSGDTGITIATTNTSKETNLYFSDGTSGAARYKGGFLYKHEDDSLRTLVNGSEKMRIVSGGNVGIGTTSPSKKLHVHGDIMTSNSGGLAVGTSTVYSNDINITNSGRLRIGNAEMLSKSSNDLNIYQGKMYITSAGNVGIGTTSPGHALQVSGNIYANAGQIYIDNGYYLSGGDATSRIYLGNDGGDGVQIYTDSSERMRIDDGGNVGIGTTSPNNPLHIHVGDSSDNFLQFTNSTTGTGSNDGVIVGIDTDESGLIWNRENIHLKFGTNNSERMRITSAGKMGIGTSSPAAELHVNGSGNTGYLHLTNSTSGSTINDGMTVGVNASNYFVFVREAAPLYFGTNATERMRITSDGKVGIGTSSPTYKFEVSNGTQKGTFNPNSSGFMFLGSTSNHPLHLGANDSTKMSVLSSGNVGIGTTSPSQKLHVSGNIQSTGNVYVGDSAFVANHIYHSGDTDTYIKFDTNRIRLVAGGTTKFDTDKTYITSAGGSLTGDLTLASNTTLHIGNVDLTTGSGGNTVSVECATSSGTAMNFKTSSGTVGAYMMYQGTTTTRFAGIVEPAADRTHDLGKDAQRWRVVYCETLDSAGQHESNLQDREQPVGQYITGTVLSWKNGKNRPCTQFADHMRMGIAVLGQDSPLIQGAEPVLCTGIVEEGDYLVTSEKEGHAVAIPRHIVKEQLLFDCVIGKALQGGEGESHLIKTWINI